MNILKTNNLTKAYDSSHGIFGLDLSVDAGDILLLLGPNGAGKTTAFNAILNLTPSTYDTLNLLNEPLTDKSKIHIGAMVSKPSFYEEFSGLAYLELFKDIYGISSTRIIEVLALVGLKVEMNKKIKTYSTGMKQRLDFARAIMHNPKLLMLDEPFSGMDIEAKADFKRILKGLNQTGIVISSHMVGDLENIANKLVIISQGKTLYSGSMDQVKSSGLTLEEFYLERIQALKEVS
ncbi:ABC transporter ATP-binding protein [Acidaminobacter sp. JC074]|uniref:ABC transporter ATP-binding protein n=1 Tax=Acidaminobacter sp. JC074 TaxID=2530199 RepID=UPI001F0D1962|nr:ABC transporter ATP-binding protein [Acidaminobacter sp. JC074]MCH4889255.1 ABC transporter ATP-binding protein [Acidaminobacter sp. JC074]